MNKIIVFNNKYRNYFYCVQFFWVGVLFGKDIFNLVFGCCLFFGGLLILWIGDLL